MLLLLFEFQDLPFYLVELPQIMTRLLMLLFFRSHLVLFETRPNLVHDLNVGALGQGNLFLNLKQLGFEHWDQLLAFLSLIFLVVDHVHVHLFVDRVLLNHSRWSLKELLVDIFGRADWSWHIISAWRVRSGWANLLIIILQRVGEQIGFLRLDHGLKCGLCATRACGLNRGNLLVWAKGSDLSWIVFSWHELLDRVVWSRPEWDSLWLWARLKLLKRVVCQHTLARLASTALCWHAAVALNRLVVAGGRTRRHSWDAFSSCGEQVKAQRRHNLFLINNWLLGKLWFLLPSCWVDDFCLH